MFPRDSGGAASAEAYNRTSKRYRNQVEVDVLAADDATLLHTLRWCPILKQPFLGLRWGMGVVTPMSAGAASASTSAPTGRVEEQVGPIGTAIANELQRRVDAGSFGQAPQVGDPRLAGVVYMGTGTKNELINTAKQMGLSAVVLFQLPQPMQGAAAGAKRTDEQLKIHIIDVNKIVQKEISAPNTAPGALVGEADPEELAICADDFGKFLDENFVLQPMPEIQAQDVPARIKKMVGEAHDDPLTVLAEVRYDQLKGLLTAEEAAAAFKNWLSDERAKVMANGTPAQRRAMLEQWLKSIRS